MYAARCGEYSGHCLVGFLEVFPSTWTKPSRTQRLVDHMHNGDNLLIFPISSHDLNTYQNVVHKLLEEDSNRWVINPPSGNPFILTGS